MAGKKIYISSHIVCCIIYTVHYTSSQYMQSHIIPCRYSCISYKRLVSGDTKINDGGWDARNLSGFYAHCLGLNASFYMSSGKGGLWLLFEIERILAFLLILAHREKRGNTSCKTNYSGSGKVWACLEWDSRKSEFPE